MLHQQDIKALVDGGEMAMEYLSATSQIIYFVRVPPFRSNVFHVIVFAVSNGIICNNGRLEHPRLLP